MNNMTVTVNVTVENTGDVRADRLLEGQLVTRRGYVARVDTVDFVGNDQVEIRLQYQHSDAPDGRERFHALRGDTFPTLRVVIA